MKQRNELILVVLFTLLVFLPFLNKPFNVDDPFYIKIAEQIINDPLRPYSFDINWSGELRNIWSRVEATFPPLIPFYIAFIIKMFGLKEWVLHLFFIIFPLVCALSMYFISKRFVKNAFLTVLIFISTPAFLVSSNSLMLDVPLLAFMLCSIALFIYGIDKDKEGFIILSMILCGAAMLVKYAAIVLFPLFLVYIYFLGKKKYLIYILIPCGIICLWCLHNIVFYDGIHFFTASKHIYKGISLHKLISVFSFFSGCFLFPVFLLFKAKTKEALGITAIFLLLEFISMIIFGEINSAGLFSFFVSTSLFFFYKIIVNYNKTDKFLLAWFFITMLIVFLIEPWTAGRYLLIAVAPSLLIFVGLIERIENGFKNAILLVCLFITFLFGIMMGISDYLWAKSYLEISNYIKANGYNKGCFTGHFGFQYYLEKAGMKALEVNKSDIDFGYIITAKIPDPQRPAKELLLKMKLVESKSEKSRFPLKLMDPKNYAGFYSSFWGILPYNFSYSPWDQFAVFKISDQARK